jgi:hypothetical protein
MENMRTTLLFCFLISAKLCHPTLSPSLDLKQNQDKREDFFQFLESFSKNDDFQLSRINFPLLFVSWDDSFTKLDTNYIQTKDWEFRYFYFAPNNESYGQVYDNFDHKLRDTDERVFAWHGIGNGIKKYLYFKRINGLWYLIKEENLST